MMIILMSVVTAMILVFVLLLIYAPAFLDQTLHWLANNFRVLLQILICSVLICFVVKFGLELYREYPPEHPGIVKAVALIAMVIIIRHFFPLGNHDEESGRTSKPD